MSRAVDHFVDDLEKLITRYRLEYEMSYAEILGVFVLAIEDLLQELRASSNKEDEHEHEDECDET